MTIRVSAVEGFAPDRLARIRPAMQKYVGDGRLAGILSLVARRGEVVHLETVGMQDIAAGIPMTPDAIFRIYSMTKPITCAAVMMLFEEGRFRLSEPISRYLPELGGLQVLVRRPGFESTLEPLRREITIQDLFTHSAGFSYGFDDNDEVDRLYQEKFWKALEQHPAPTLVDMVNLIAKLPLAHQPGTVFHYSVAIDVLGRLVEVLSGQTLEQFFTERIFEPLGMVDTGFWVPPEKAHRLAVMYGADPDRPGQLKDLDPHAKSSYLRPATLFSGGGGLVSTAADYLRFCQMLLNGGELDGVRLLGRKTVELMALNHLPPGVYTNDNQAFGFGLGGQVLLDVARSQNLGSVGNWNWGGAANTEFWIDFKEQLIGILMLQFQPPGTYPIENDFNNLVYQALI